MKHLNTIMAAVLACFSCSGQTVGIDSIPLPYNIGLHYNSYFGSRMLLEGETVSVPTSNGLYSLDLKNIDKGWSLQGFEGENLIECVHLGEEWLAITRNQNMRLLLHSADNGKTIEDYTPYSFFTENKYRNVLRLCQDPVTPETIYLLSGYAGILKSNDFGKTWKLITDEVNSNNTYCGFEIHPLNTDILLQHAENGALEPSIQISHNGGIDWISSNGYPTPDIVLPKEPDYSEDCIHDVAFHPTDINTWVFGGEGLLAKTVDGGRTWVHKGQSWGYHYSTVYDKNNPDILYSPGANGRREDANGWIFLVSTDSGETWKDVFLYIPDDTRLCSMQQTDDDLIILNPEKLFFVKKKDLLSTSGLQEIHVNESITCDNNIYSIAGSVVMYNADDCGLEKLPKGIYIYKKNKVIVK